MLKVGDVVRLNSGGPAMTVADVDEPIIPRGLGMAADEFVLCYWFDAGERREATFSPHVLTTDPAFG